MRASVARQRQRLLEAYLAEVIDLACFQRQDRGLAGQEADLLAREREVAAQGERLAQVSAIAQSMTQVLQQLRAGLGQAGFEQRRQESAIRERTSESVTPGWSAKRITEPSLSSASWWSPAAREDA